MQRRWTNTKLVTIFVSISIMLFSSLLLAHGPIRQKVTESIEIDASADEVWEVIGNFGDMSWLKIVQSTESEGANETGATRVLTLGPDVKVYETLKKHEPEAMSYSYKIPNDTHDVNILPVNNYSSTISVEANGDKSTVVWKGAFYRGYAKDDPPAELNDEAALNAVTGLYKEGLASLKEFVEAGK